MSNIPRHIGVIMDGNGRWAKKRGLMRSIGHREGARNLRKIVEACYDIGIKYLTVFAFSTENWSRPEAEVKQLMSLLSEYLKNAENELKGKNIRIRVIGDKERLPEDIKNAIAQVERNTEKRDGLSFNIALNYGGRQDIIQAARKLAEDVKKGLIEVEDIDETQLEKRLFTAGIPDPDLLIRTSGEMRISNFLIWQCQYTEFYFCRTLWPDFSRKDLEKALLAYQERSRRYGSVK